MTEAADFFIVVNITAIPKISQARIGAEVDHAGRPAGAGEKIPTRVVRINQRVDIIHGQLLLRGRGQCQQRQDTIRRETKQPAGFGDCSNHGTLDAAWSVSEKGARLCRRPAAARGQRLNAPSIRDLLRLVEADTAALRDVQTRSWNIPGWMDGNHVHSL